MRTLAMTLIVLTLAAVVPAAAQEAFPTRSIMIVNPYPPGGQADLAGRPFTTALEKVLKQPVVITNKAGAAGAVGMQSVAVAKPVSYQDADEFKAWLDADAVKLAEVIKKIGKVEVK